MAFEKPTIWADVWDPSNYYREIRGNKERLGSGVGAKYQQHNTEGNYGHTCHDSSLTQGNLFALLQSLFSFSFFSGLPVNFYASKLIYSLYKRGGGGLTAIFHGPNVNLGILFFSHFSYASHTLNRNLRKLHPTRLYKQFISHSPLAKPWHSEYVGGTRKSNHAVLCHYLVSQPQ